MVTYYLVLTGRVQGVGYRAWTQKTAIHHGLVGWVRNLPDGKVEIEVQGDRQTLKIFLASVKKGPRGARVDSVDVARHTTRVRFSSFDVR